MQITDKDNGFEVEDRRGVRRYEDDQVVSVSLDTTEKHSAGVLKHVNRTFVIHVAGPQGDEEIAIKDKLKPGEYDPHADLIRRLSENYAARARQALDAGMKLSGKNWTLDSGSLTVLNGQQEDVSSMGDLARIDVFDGNVCVWRRGVNDPILKTPVSSKNAFVLELILGPIVEANDITDDGDGLGHVLFERKASFATIVMLVILGVGSMLVIPVMLVLAVTDREPVPFLIIAGIACALVPTFFISAYASSRRVFRCQSRGVFSDGLLGSRELRYTDVASFQYGVTRHYTNGVYTGTNLNMKFTPRDKSQKAISYSVHSKKLDTEFDMIRDHIARVIASEMWERLGRGDEAPWTDNAVFDPDGIKYRPSGFFGRKDWKKLEYKNIHGFDIMQGTFHLWEKGVEKSVLQETTAAENFFPGYYLICMMSSDNEGQAEEGPAA